MNDTNLSAARESSRHLADLLRREHGALADFLVALAEFDRAGSYRRLGYAHVFDYLPGGWSFRGRGPLPARSRPGWWGGSPRWWSRCETGGSA